MPPAPVQASIPCIHILPRPSLPALAQPGGFPWGLPSLLSRGHPLPQPCRALDTEVPRQQSSKGLFQEPYRSARNERAAKFMKNGFLHLSTVHRAAVTALTRRDNPQVQVTAGSSTAHGQQTCGSPATCSGCAARINGASQPVGLIAQDVWQHAQLSPCKQTRLPHASSFVGSSQLKKPLGSTLWAKPTQELPDRPLAPKPRIKPQQDNLKPSPEGI